MSDHEQWADDLLRESRDRVALRLDLDPDRWAIVAEYCDYDGSGLLHRANLETMEAALEENPDWGDDWYTVGAAYNGRILAVQIRGEDGEITPAGYAVIDMHNALSEYPVLDDDRLGELEVEDAHETWGDSGCYSTYGMDLDTAINAGLEYEVHSDGVYFRQEDIDAIAYELGALVNCTVCGDTVEMHDWREDHEQDGDLWIGACDNCRVDDEPGAVALYRAYAECAQQQWTSPLF